MYLLAQLGDRTFWDRNERLNDDRSSSDCAREVHMCLLAQLGDSAFEARKEGVRDDERLTDLLSENA